MIQMRSVRRSIAVVLACGVLAVMWIVTAHSLDLVAEALVSPRTNGVHLFALVSGHTGTWIQQMIGVFGWLDTQSPLVTYLVWSAAVGTVVVIALSVATGRQVLMLALVMAIVIVAPIAISYSQAHRLGIVWQGRYMMPIAVGVPLVGVAIIDKSPLLRWPRARFATVLCIGIGVARAAAFAEALRRYSGGVSGGLG